MRRYLIVAIILAFEALLWGGLVWAIFYDSRHGGFYAVTIISPIVLLSTAIVWIFRDKLDSHWDQFAKEFARAHINSKADRVYGEGAIPNAKRCRQFRLGVVVNSAGIILEYDHAQLQPTALIPWTHVLNLMHATVVNIKGKPCKPFQIARIYIDGFNLPITVPWQEAFNAFVPEQVGFTNMGQADIR